MLFNPSGHFAIQDSQRQSFDDRGLADARFADQDRIVLGATLQHLDGSADLVVATDHGVEFAVFCPLGEIDRVFLERLTAFFRVRVLHRFSLPDSCNGFFESFALYRCFAKRASDGAGVFACGEQHDFGGNELVAEFLCMPIGEVQQSNEIRTKTDVAGGLFDGRLSIEFSRERVLEVVDATARLELTVGARRLLCLPAAL